MFATINLVNRFIKLYGMCVCVLKHTPSGTFKYTILLTAVVMLYIVSTGLFIIYLEVHIF